MAKYYVICDDDCRYESMTREQILAAIEQALEQGYVSDPDAAVFSKIKEIGAGNAVQLWVGTEAEFNALSPAPDVGRAFVRVGANGIVYLCSDDETARAFEAHMRDTNNPHKVTLEQVLNGKSLGITYSTSVFKTHDRWIDGKLICAIVYTGSYSGNAVNLLVPPGIGTVIYAVGRVGRYMLGSCNADATDSVRFYLAKTGDYFVLDSFASGEYNVVVYFTSAVDYVYKDESESGLDNTVLA